MPRPVFWKKHNPAWLQINFSYRATKTHAISAMLEDAQGLMKLFRDLLLATRDCLVK